MLCLAFLCRWFPSRTKSNLRLDQMRRSRILWVWRRDLVSGRQTVARPTPSVFDSRSPSHLGKQTTLHTGSCLGYAKTLLLAHFVRPAKVRLGLCPRSGWHADINKINIPPYNGGYFSFGHSPNTTGGAQVRCLLACQPCNRYLPPVNGFHCEPPLCKGRWHFRKKMTEGLSKKQNFSKNNPSVSFADSSLYTREPFPQKYSALTCAFSSAHRHSPFWTPPLWRGFRDTKKRPVNRQVALFLHIGIVGKT